MAKVVVKDTHVGGMESHISNLGLALLIVGTILCVIFLIASGIAASATWVLFGLASLLQGIVLFIVLRAGAEVIRLLKKLNGLNFAGTISEPRTGQTSVCSECGARIWLPKLGEVDKCRKCKAPFE